MRYRDAKMEDVKRIKQINNQLVHGYDLDTPQFVLAGVVEDDEGKVIGFGGVKIIHECVVILDQEQSKRKRTEALKLLIRNGCALSKRLGIEFWHAFCDNEFAAFLTKWFDYKPAEGTALVLRTEEHVEKRREEDERTPGVGPEFCKRQIRLLRTGTGTGESSSE